MAADNDNGLDPSRMIWIGGIVLLAFGLGIVLLRPPEAPREALPTPGPSPEVGSLQCLDGKVFRSMDEIVGQAREDGGFPTKGRWTITFAGGGYVLDQIGAHEAGRYRCDGATIHASSALGSHRGHRDDAAGRLAWDGQGYELTDAGPPVHTATPATTTTSG